MAISSAETRKPATASPIDTPAALVARTAAPGVDQAVTTGIFQRSDRAMQVAPMPMPRAHIQEAVCAGVASNACAAWNTIAAVLAKPTSTVTKPAAMEETELSRNSDTDAERIMDAAIARGHGPVPGAPRPGSARPPWDGTSPGGRSAG